MLNDDNILRSSPPGDLEFDKQKWVDGCIGGGGDYLNPHKCKICWISPSKLYIIKCEFSLLYAYVLHVLFFS